MTYRDDAARVAHVDQLRSQRDEALARAEALQRELTSLHAWLEDEEDPHGTLSFRAVVWAGLGSLGGSSLGALLWQAFGNSLLIPLTTLAGATLMGLVGIGVRTNGDAEA